MNLLNDDRAHSRPFIPIILVSLALLPIAGACQDTADPATDEAAPATSEAAPAAAATENADIVLADATTADAPYAIECGQTNDAGEPFCYVDGDTYIGWRTFHGFCHVCHAQDAVGSTFAPNLLDRIADFDFEMFVDRTANGYTGQVGVMPPWKDNPNVSKRYKELYAYLRARADGALPPGRPKKMPKK